MIKNSSKFKLLCFSLTALSGLAACESTPGSKKQELAIQGSQGADTVDRALAQAGAANHRQQNQSESIFVLERAYKRNPDDMSTAVSYARALRQNDLAQRALIILKPHMVEPDKVSADALTEYAAITLALGQYQKAENSARQAVIKDPDWHRAYHVLGIALDAQGFHKQAEVAFRRGLEKWKGDPVPVLNNLALSMAAQGYLEESLNILRKASDSAPNRKEIERNLRIISALHQNMQGRATQASTSMPEAGAPGINPPFPSQKPTL